MAEDKNASAGAVDLAGAGLREWGVVVFYISVTASSARKECAPQLRDK